jgi:hypothetical protein
MVPPDPAISDMHVDSCIDCIISVDVAHNVSYMPYVTIHFDVKQLHVVMQRVDYDLCIERETFL